MLQKILELIELDPKGWAVGMHQEKAKYRDQLTIGFGEDKIIGIGNYEIRLVKEDAEEIRQQLWPIARDQIDETLDRFLEGVKAENDILEGWEYVPIGFIQAGDMYRLNDAWSCIEDAMIGKPAGSVIIIRKVVIDDTKNPEAN